MLLFPPPSPPLFPPANFTPNPSSLAAEYSSAPPSGRAGYRAYEVDVFTQSSWYLFDLSSSEAESLAEYNVSRIAAIYRRKPFILLRRLFQISTTLGKWFAFRYYDRITERSDLMFQAYVKIAQAISSGPDLIPRSYLDELSLLQDRIAPIVIHLNFQLALLNTWIWTSMHSMQFNS